MLVVGIISLVTSLVMIASVLFFPKIRIGKASFESYWIICLLGALSLIVFGFISVQDVLDNLLANTAINPLKIVTLFISMTALSIFLDEIGFFEYLASWTLHKAKSNQVVLFLYLYILTSILTVFTANDIIILTFTPFICYFAKNAKINPIPYLVGEFVAANTWSMMLIIGNPTNIYLGVASGITFFEYAKIMFIPTVICGFTTLGILFLVFNKSLKQPISTSEVTKKPDKFLLIVGLVHLAACTILLSISSYIGFEMWFVTLGFAISLLVIVSISKLVRKTKEKLVLKTLKRMPWTLVPFVLSMAIIVGALKQYQVTDAIAEALGGKFVGLEYGLASFFSANLINNIPMSILFSKIVVDVTPASQTLAVYATIVGSNLGAILTPIGALAGIMWMSILKEHGIKYNYRSFLKYGIVVGIPAIFVTILVLAIIL